MPEYYSNKPDKNLRAKAVRNAWKNEKALVQQGKGTRDWTTEQQISILTKGKAYDSNGKAFQGHHMKNVKDHPELQGDWRNIQFLTRQEHLEAHHNNFKNKTTGKYDSESKTTKNFSTESLSQPKSFNLSNKVSQSKIEADKNKMSAQKLQNKSKAAENFSKGKSSTSQSKSSPQKSAAAKFSAYSGKQQGAKTPSPSHSRAASSFGESQGASKGSSRGTAGVSQGASHGAAKGGRGHGR